MTTNEGYHPSANSQTIDASTAKFEGANSDAISDLESTAPTRGEIEFERAIQAANRVAKLHLHKFAQVGRFTMPFSDQLKNEIRDSFPEDKEIFNSADKLQRSAAISYLVLRIFTLSLFTAYIFTSFGPLQMISSVELANFTPPAWLFTVVAVGALSGLFYLIRKTARAIVFSAIIQPKVQELAYGLGNNYNELDDSLKGASGKIEIRADRSLPNLSWKDRAYGHTKIMLWYAKRLDALDRYATTVMWKMDVFDKRVEDVTRYCKFAIWFVGCFILLMGTPFTESSLYSGEGAISPSAAATATTTFLALYLIWIKSDHIDTNYWKSLLSSKVRHDTSGEDTSAPSGYYFDIMATRVENLVAQLLHAQRAQDKTSKEKTDS